MRKIETFKDREGRDHLVFLFTRDMVYELMFKGLFGPGVCDHCNSSLLEDNEDKYIYLIPELRDTYCIKCTKDYFRRAKHYREDLDYLKEYVLQMIKIFSIDLDETEQTSVNLYLDYLESLKEVLPYEDI